MPNLVQKETELLSEALWELIGGLHFDITPLLEDRSDPDLLKVMTHLQAKAATVLTVVDAALGEGPSIREAEMVNLVAKDYPQADLRQAYQSYKHQQQSVRTGTNYNRVITRINTLYKRYLELTTTQTTLEIDKDFPIG